MGKTMSVNKEAIIEMHRMMCDLEELPLIKSMRYGELISIEDHKEFKTNYRQECNINDIEYIIEFISTRENYEYNGHQMSRLKFVTNIYKDNEIITGGHKVAEDLAKGFYFECTK